MVFYFDGQKYFTLNTNKNFQPGFYEKDRQPFDHPFYLILNVAVGGDFLAGPDENDIFNYPEAEMWVDWVKWYTNCDLGWNTDCPPLPTWVPETQEPTDDNSVSTPGTTQKPTVAPTAESGLGPDWAGDNEEGLVCEDGQPCPSYFEDFTNLDGWDTPRSPDSDHGQLQFYTDRKRNVRAEDGYLKITPLREDYKHRDYTSGQVTSKHHYKYGRIEIKAKHPNGKGLWPLISMMPQDNSKFQLIIFTQNRFLLYCDVEQLHSSNKSKQLRSRCIYFP